MQLLLANVRLLGYLFVISALLGSGWFLHHSGYNKGVSVTTLQYETKIEAERNRISIANKAALKQAEQRQAILLNSLRSREDEIEKLRQEAEADPSANDGALSVDSVRRINQIK